MIFGRKKVRPVVLNRPNPRRQVASSGVQIRLSTALLSLAAFGAVWYAVTGYLPHVPLPKAQLPSEENIALIRYIAETVDLPKEEIPIIGAINNLEKLRGDNFFKDANLGDKIIVYCDAKRTYLFSIVEKRVINTKNESIREVCPITNTQ